MVTYWLLGNKSLDSKCDDNGAVPSTSSAGDYNTTNPSITLQRPNTPVESSEAQDGGIGHMNHPDDKDYYQKYSNDYVYDSDSDNDDLQSQGACALPLNHQLRANSTNQGVYRQEDDIDGMCYQETPLDLTTTNLSVILPDEGTRIQREMDTYAINEQVKCWNDIVEELKSKKDDNQNSSRVITLKRSYEIDQDSERQSNGDEQLATPNFPTVISKGKVRETVLKFNRQWQNDDDSKKHN